jgi:hypothetical protein
MNEFIILLKIYSKELYHLGVLFSIGFIRGLPRAPRGPPNLVSWSAVMGFYKVSNPPL